MMYANLRVVSEITRIRCISINGDSSFSTKYMLSKKPCMIHKVDGIEAVFKTTCRQSLKTVESVILVFHATGFRLASTKGFLLQK